MRRSVLWLVPALLAAGCDRRSAGDGQGGGTAAAANVAQASPDEVAPAAAPATAPAAGGTIDPSHAGTAAPGFTFDAPDGRPTSLAAFRGRPVLLNLWATWCGPCVRELPTLDALAAREGAKLAVVTLSQDMDPAKAKAFLAGRGLSHLGAYTDAKMQWLAGTTATLPTSILYGADGRERWRVVGDLDWTGAKAAKALAEPG